MVESRALSTRTIEGANVKPGLADSLLDSLPVSVAVLDHDGFIIAVNECWKHFSRQNGGTDPDYYVGTSYLEVCEDAIQGGAGGTPEQVLKGLKKLLTGEQERFSVEYPFDTPRERLWFIVEGNRFMHEGDHFVMTRHEDITERKRAEHKLYDTQRTLRKVLDALPVGVWIMNAQGRIVDGNPAGKNIWGGVRYVGPEEFHEYKAWWLDSGRRIKASEWAGARAVQKGETSLNEELVIESFDGERKIVLNSAIPLKDALGNVIGAIIVNEDITEQKNIEAELRRASNAVDEMNRELHRLLVRERKKARTDELTGLNNRRFFFDVAGELFSVALRYQTPFSVILFDVDHFKKINDTYGHHFGDVMLKRVADAVHDHTRLSDVLARFGGEEFALALPNTSARGAYAVAEEVRRRVAMATETFEEKDISVTISAGVAEILPGDEKLEDVTRRADKALYAAKNAGRNCTRPLYPSS